MDNLELSLKKCSFMVSGKCISHFKMLLSVSKMDAGRISDFLANFGPTCHWCRLKQFDSDNYFQKHTSSKSRGFLFFKIGFLGQIWPKFGPNSVHLTHFVTGVGSSYLINALTVVITFRNVLWVEVSGFYFINWLFGPDLAQTWSKFGPIWFI